MGLIWNRCGKSTDRKTSGNFTRRVGGHPAYIDNHKATWEIK